MVEEIDIWRVAKQYLDRYGEDAAFEAAQQADRLLDAGELEGARVWRRIIKAIAQLANTKPPGGITH